jgi:tRNA G46 methylase TrmB
VLKPDGEFWFITDWPDYAEQGGELLKSRNDFKTEVVPEPNWWAPTKYQQKAQKAGRSNSYIVSYPKVTSGG